MTGMGRSGTLAGLVVAILVVGGLAVASPALAVTTTTPVAGSMGPTQEGCPQKVATFVVGGENCMYDGGPSSVVDATPFGEVTGSYLQITYYDSIATPAAFESTVVGVARKLYAPTTGDGKMSQKITGSVTIDDGGDGFGPLGVPDLISFTLTLTSSGAGDIVRNYLSSTNSVVDKYSSMTQTLAPTAATSATANAAGGFDYVIGSEGFPALRTYSQTGPCLGKTLGFVDCNHTLTAADEPDYWNGTSAAGLGSLESNLGARTTGTVTNLQCIDARLGTGEETADCHDSAVSFAPWVTGPCATKGGCTGNEGTPGSVRGAAEDVGWDQLLIRVSTDASGNVTSVAAFNVDEYNVFGTTRCGNNTAGTGSFSVNCNSWTSGYFTLNSTLGGQANDDLYFATPGFNLDIPVLNNDTNFVDPVTVTVVLNPTQGVAVVSGSPGPGAGISIRYTANSGATGSDGFPYSVTDGVSTDIAVVGLVIGAGANKDSKSTARNQPVNIPVGANDPGFDNSVTVTVNNGSFSAGGSALVTAGNGGPASGVVVTYTPVSAPSAPNYVETFTYTLDDGVLPPSTATVSVTVNNSIPGNLNGAIEGSTIGVNPAGVKVTFTPPPGGGSLGDPPSTIAISVQGNRGTATVAGKVITYTITDETFFFGEDSYTYTVTDADGESASGIVTVSIPQVGTVFKDTFIVVGQGRISKPLAPDFSAPDPTSTENPPQTKKYFFNGSPEQQILAISGQGTEGVCTVSPNNATGKVIYTPNDSTFVGTDSCQFTLNDADGNVIIRPITITVTAKERVGGAGSFDWPSLLLLGFAPLLRRRPRRAGGKLYLRAAGTAVALATFLSGGLTASGQDAEESQSASVAAPPAQGPAAEAKGTGRNSAAIDEIVVTSRKVEENLQEVPLAITAFDSNAIERLGITSLSDVASLTPGLSFFNALGETLPVPVIRGIAPTDIFGENNAAIFVDGVYVSGREGLNFSQLDVERIEVVKGPQSALYGRNAFAGAINYVTKPPSEEFSARTDMEVGNRGKVLGSATVSGPILGEKLRGRIAAVYDDWDGSYDNAIAGGNDIGGHTFRSIQASLLWLPADDWTTSLSYYTSNDDIDEAASVSLPANCQDRVGDNNATVRLQNFCGEIPALEDIPGLNGSDAIPIITQGNGEHRELDRANFKIDWDLHERGSVSALSGYSHTDQNSQLDFARGLGENQVFLYCVNPDGAPLGPGGPFPCGENPANQRFTTGIYDREPGTVTDDFSQELRFTSPQDQRWRYTVGGYFFTVDKTSAATPAGATLRGATIATQPLPGSFVGLPPFAPSSPNLAIGSAIFYATFLPDGGQDPLDRTQYKSGTKGWALFGGSDFDLTDQLIFRTELRLSEESQDLRNYTFARCAETGVDALELCGDDRFDLRVRAAQPYGDCVPTSLDSLGTGSCSHQTSDRFKSVTGRIGLDWRFTDEWMVYGSIAYGDKPGGLEFASGTVVKLDGSREGRFYSSTFDQEELTAYELGLKGTTWDGRLVISTSVYYNDWRKIVLPQLRDNDPNDGLPLLQPTSFRVNAGDAGVLGFEIEANAGFTENLTGRFTLGWADAKIKSATQDAFALFPDYAAEGFDTVGGDVSGNTLLRQPEWLLSGSLDYQHQLFGDWEWFTGADANYQSGIYVGNDNQGWLPSHTYVNTRLGIRSGAYTIQAWARNLFDDNKAVASFRDIYFANTDNQYAPAVDQGPRPNFDDFVPWRQTVSYPSERTYGLTFLMRFGAAVQ